MIEPVSTSVRTFLALAVLAFPVFAQDDGWTTIPIDSAATVPARRGLSATFQTPDHVLLYSAVLDTFTWVPASAGAIVTTQNEHVIVQDGNVFHGWSARIGEVESITVSASGAVVAGPGSANFTFVVQDGSDVHAFSSETGQWATLTTPSAGVTVLVDRRCVLVSDGVTAWAFGTPKGLWVPFTAVGATQIDTSTSMAWVHTPTSLRYFSAHTGQWHTMPVGDTSSLVSSADSAFTFDGNVVTAFSSLTGTFDTHTAPTSGVFVMTNGDVAVTVDGDDFACYSSFRGTFAPMTIPGGIALIDAGYVLISDATDVYAYSGIRGTYAAPLNGSFTLNLADHVAVAQGTSDVYVYSDHFHQWVAAPAHTAFNLLQSSVIFTDATGFTGVSSRRPTFSHVDADPSATITLPSPRGETCLISDVDRVHAWSPRLSRFETVSVDTSTIAGMSAAFSGAIFETGSAAYGFGIHRASWVVTALQGMVSNSTPGSGVGYVVTDNHLAVHSNYGSFSSASLFPEGTGETINGGDIKVQQVGEPTSSVVALVGFGPGNTSTFVGSLLIDLNQPILVVELGVIGMNGRLDVDIATPATPALIGVETHIQNLVTSPTGHIYLTNSISPVIL